MADVKKSKISKEGLRNAFRLYRFIKPYQTEYFIGLFFLLGSSSASLVFPKLLGDLVNYGNEGRISEELNRVALILAGVLIIQHC